MRLVRNYIRKIVAEVLAERERDPDWRAVLDQQTAVNASMDEKVIYYDRR